MGPFLSLAVSVSILWAATGSLKFIAGLLAWAWLAYSLIKAGHFRKSAPLNKAFFIFLLFYSLLPALLSKIFRFSTGNFLFSGGLTFLGLQLFSVLVELRKNPREEAPKPLDLFNFLFYFPKFFWGPIEKFFHFRDITRNAAPLRTSNLGIAFFLLSSGAFKKFVLAEDAIQFLYRASETGGAAGPATILFFYISGISLYCEFSGLIDIARGVSLLLGIELQKNFDFPLLSRDPIDFWRRWHMSLMNWLREYIFLPLAGWTKSFYFSIFITVFLTAFWHDFNAKFFAAGIYCGLWTVSYLFLRQFYDAHFANIPGRVPAFLIKILSRFTHFTLVCAGLSFLQAPTLMEVSNLLGTLFESGNSSRTILYGFEFFLLVIGLWFCESGLYRRNGQERALTRSDFIWSYSGMSCFAFVWFYFGVTENIKSPAFLYSNF